MATTRTPKVGDRVRHTPSSWVGTVVSMGPSGASVRFDNNGNIHTYHYFHYLEVIDMKKLNEATVRAVGGCQYDALVKLLKEMGHEVVEQPKGVRVRVGQRVKVQSDTHCTVAPKGTNSRDTQDTTMSLWADSGNDYYTEIASVRTLKDEQVIGYEK